MDMLTAKAAMVNLDLVYEIDHDIPLHLIADSMRLKQILINLISNAIKFTPQGEVFIGIRLNSTIPDGSIQLAFDVKDTGIGIPKEKISYLFEAFSQVDSSTTRKYGGTGLGLAICERLVNLLGGSIGVESKLGEGTTFYFPIQAQLSREALPTHVAYTMAGYEGKHILIVDDNKTNRRILQLQLEQWKLYPTMAASAHEALQLLDKQIFELVLTDMQMPDMDGVQLAKLIKEKKPKLPIVLLSSIGDESKNKFSQLFLTTLTKPVKQQLLCKTIIAGLQHIPGLQEPEQPKPILLTPDFAQQNPLRLLVAEDNLINQKLIVRVLNKLGYNPLVALNGLEVLSLMQYNVFDVILMDMQMPEMGGIEATMVIRSLQIDQPIIIAITANVMQEDKEACLKAGMNDYLSKPVRLEELLQALTQATSTLLK
jgi:CheY-like chemotaxis protein